MPNIDISKWDSIWQYFLALGGFIAGAFMWVFGYNRAKNAPVVEDSDRLQSLLDDAKIRDDLMKVVEAQRLALEKKHDDFRDEMRREIRGLEHQIWDLKVAWRPGPQGPAGPEGPQGPKGEPGVR